MNRKNTLFDGSRLQITEILGDLIFQTIHLFGHIWAKFDSEELRPLEDGSGFHLRHMQIRVGWTCGLGGR